MVIFKHGLETKVVSLVNNKQDIFSHTDPCKPRTR